MADPIFSEATILNMLDAPASLAAVEPLRTGAILALVNGFDRKIQRDPFSLLVSSAVELHTNLGHLVLLDRMNTLNRQQQLTAEKFNEALINTIATCETGRLSLLHQMKLIAQCPTSYDKIS